MHEKTEHDLQLTNMALSVLSSTCLLQIASYVFDIYSLVKFDRSIRIVCFGCM